MNGENMKKAKLNYWIDVSIAITFVLSAISGLVFLLPVGFESGILGISYSLWNQLHTWSSVGMIAGVLAHLMLHWKWIASMTKKMLFREQDLPKNASPVTNTASKQCAITRRQFLKLGLATLLTGAIAAGCSAFVREWAADTTQDYETDTAQDDSSLPVQQQEDVSSADDGSNSPSQQENNDIPAEEPKQPVQQQSGVACPRGLINDPYPGRCRRYTDRNGDGICDYSVPGSGNN
jgi:hypothetical protein